VIEELDQRRREEIQTEWNDGRARHRRIDMDAENLTIGGQGVDRFTRRRLITATGVAGLGALAMASGLGACTSNSTQTGAAASSTGTGKKRKIVWAIAAIGEWNLPVDVGFND